MTLITIEGIYENGKVELAELPEGVEWAKVRVTFLAETRDVEENAQHVATLSTAGEGLPVVEGRYPSSLREEYAALIHKTLHRTITPAEANRLEAVRAEINRIDSQSESWQAWEQRAAAMDAELAALKRQLEALPEA